ncbi:hypothetical protein HXX76_003949 [Chlamydomonas incerta]|uniref:AB hydrolase-1 domain-containing protein n=1 Tax=Chlamydomonas incerta TaxID=51695 RepID=A0A835T8Z3_CHLIN|nr:hypothetical protein HXX76_003949 [Chlamydomonas incerta]|eukprot:KAG2441097.1 hypothetical protein HXX76_003949 [Chlamydomonas incerta]
MSHVWPARRAVFFTIALLLLRAGSRALADVADAVANGTMAPAKRIGADRPEEPRRALVWPVGALRNTLTIQRFGLSSRVALDTSVSSEYSVLPHHYWIWLQASHILNTSCPDCSWTEVGGPGLIAFRMSAVPWNSSRPPAPAAWVPSDTPWHHMLAGMTIDINGYLANVTTLLPPSNGSSNSATSSSSSLSSSGGGSLAAGELPPVDAYAMSKRVMLLVDFCYGCRPRVDLAVQLLRSKRVFAMVILVAPRSSHFDIGSSSSSGGGSSGGAAGQGPYDCRDHLAALLAAAAAAGLEGYVGGFDGAPLQPAAAAAAATASGAAAADAALAAVAKSPVPLGFYFSAAAAEAGGGRGRLLPAPALHVFMPLKGPAKYLDAKMPVYCRTLLDTSAHAGLSGLHLMGPTVRERLYRKPMVAGKLHLFLRLLRLDADKPPSRIAPWDVLLVIDATDTLAQVSTAELLVHYRAAGSPLFQASTETSCWPKEMYPLCHAYERLPGAAAWAAWPNRRINGGAYLGRAALVTKYVGDVVDVLNRRFNNESWYPAACAESRNDQALLACPYLFGNAYGLTLDYDSTFFFSLNRNWQRLELVPAPGGSSSSSSGSSGGDAAAQDAAWQPQRWRYNVSGAIPAILHGNSRGGKERLRPSRQALLPPRYSGMAAHPGYSLLMDGKPVNYSRLCAGAFRPPPPPPRGTRVRSDGYRLALFRLVLKHQADPNASNSSRAGAASPALQQQLPQEEPAWQRGRRPPVLLHHGFPLSANAWLPLPREQGLAYLLADRGYDVWILSQRGSTHSLSHDTLSPSSKEFWRYKVDDLALQDLPALADHVRAATGAARIATVSWSAGATVTFMYGSAAPEAAAERFCAHVALAPVVFPQRIVTPLFAGPAGTGADKARCVWRWSQLLLPSARRGLGLARGDDGGGGGGGRPAACVALLLLAYGPVSRASLGDVERIAEMYRRGPHDPVLLKIDYGVVCSPPHARGGDGSCNQAVYGSAAPPPYNVSRYSIPTTIFTGGRDAVSVPWDSEQVAAVLKAAAAAAPSGGGSGALRRLVYLPSYGHVDFTWYDARPILDDVLLVRGCVVPAGVRWRVGRTRWARATRGALLPPRYSGMAAHPGYSLLMDGKPVNYSRLCAGAFRPPPPPPRGTRVRSDGYRLALFRLVLKHQADLNASNSSRAGAASPALQQQQPQEEPAWQRGRRPPVLLHHGFPLSANAWLPLPREQGLAYLLADRGYDVWILSQRGSTHSLSHDTLSPSSKEFWRYKMDDLGLQDLPALADHVRAATGAARIATVSWSAGATVTFMYGSAAPEAAAERFCAHVALAPVVFPQRLSTPLFAGLAGTGADKALDHIDVQRFSPALVQTVLGPLCGGGARPGPDAPLPQWSQLLLPSARRGLGLGHGNDGGGGGRRPAACVAALLVAYGPVSRASWVDVERIAEVAWPSTFGLEYSSQFGQMYRRGPHDPVLLKFDYGVVCSPPHARGGDGSCNQAVYGSAAPPPYNVSRYSIPTTIFTGGRDAVSVPWDSEQVAAVLKAAAAAAPSGGGGGALRRLVYLPSYGHVDFTWYDARPILDDVLRAIHESC